MVSESSSISEIVLNLRSAFRAADFDRAEEALLAREAALRRQIPRLDEQESLSAAERVRAENAELLESRDLLRAENAELRRELEEARASLRAAEEAASEGGKTSSDNEVLSAEEPILLLDSDDEPDLPSKESSPKLLKIERSPPLIPSAKENAATSRAEPNSPSKLTDASKSFWGTIGNIEVNSASSSSYSNSDSSA